MSLYALNNVSKGNDAGAMLQALMELQGLTITAVAGAAAGTAMAVAALRTEDTLLAVLTHLDAGGAFANDVANCTIQPTKASGTLTVSGNPVDGETFVVGVNTYTWKTTPTAIGHVKIVAGDNNAMAANVASAINSVENKRVAVGNQAVPNVVATVVNAVVTVTSTTDGVGNAPVVSKTGAPITVSNSGTASVTAAFVSAVNGNVLTVNGVAFNIKTTPVDLNVDIGVKGTDILQAAEMVRVITAYENKYGTLGVTCSNGGTNTVTIVPRGQPTGNITVLTEAATNFAASGSGTLAGGTATGGIKSTTNLANTSVLVFWYNKTP